MDVLEELYTEEGADNIAAAKQLLKCKAGLLLEERALQALSGDLGDLLGPVYKALDNTAKELDNAVERATRYAVTEGQKNED